MSKSSVLNRTIAPACTEQVDLLLQAVRHRHRPAIAPELGIVALRDMVVKDQKVPDRGILEVQLGVELTHQGRIARNDRERTPSIARCPPGSDGCWSTPEVRESRWTDQVQHSFVFQICFRLPVVNRSCLGSASALPGADCVSVADAASSSTNALEYTCPLPVRCCNGISHCHPADARWSGVNGSSLPLPVDGSAKALSHGNQCDQSSYPLSNACSIRTPRSHCSR